MLAGLGSLLAPDCCTPDAVWFLLCVASVGGVGMVVHRSRWVGLDIVWMLSFVLTSFAAGRVVVVVCTTGVLVWYCVSRIYFRGWCIIIIVPTTENPRMGT